MSGVLTQLVDELNRGTLKVVDLTQPLGPSTPVIGLPPMFAPSPGATIDVISRYDDKGPAWYWNTIRMGEHTGTHFDAPVHWITGKDLPNNACDTIPASRFIGAACVIDVTSDVTHNPDFLLTVERLEQWEANHGRIPAGPGSSCEPAGAGVPTPRRSSTPATTVRTVPGSTRARRNCWRRTGTCWASGSKRSEPTPARPPRSILLSPTMQRCTAPASSGWRACATSISFRRRAPS